MTEQQLFFFILIMGTIISAALGVLNLIYLLVVIRKLNATKKELEAVRSDFDNLSNDLLSSVRDSKKSIMIELRTGLDEQNIILNKLQISQSELNLLLQKRGGGKYVA